MGRKIDTDITEGLERRAFGKQSAEVPVAQAAPEPAPAKTKRPSSRDGLKFVGFYTTEEQTEKLRVLAFETRKEKQVLMREALDLLFKKYV